MKTPSPTLALRSQAAALLLLLSATAAYAGEPMTAEQSQQLREHFDAKYKSYLGGSGQSLLPFPQLDPQDWKKLKESQTLRQVFIEPEVFYNDKNYRFTMYQAENGNYYLDAKGGFWGMDELFYGPIDKNELN